MTGSPSNKMFLRETEVNLIWKCSRQRKRGWGNGMMDNTAGSEGSWVSPTLTSSLTLDKSLKLKHIAQHIVYDRLSMSI